MKFEHSILSKNIEIYETIGKILQKIKYFGICYIYRVLICNNTIFENTNTNTRLTKSIKVYENYDLATQI